MPANPNQPYDPLNQQPYQAPEMPQPTAPADAAASASGAGSSLGDSKGYDFTRPGAGNISHGGAIAGVADNILKGFMNGKAKGEAMKAMQMKRQTDNIQSAYNLSAKNLSDLNQAGINEKSTDPEQVKQYKDAKAAVDGSWSALMNFYGQHIQPPDSGKKGKGAKAKEGLAGMFQSQDPAQVSQAWYQVMQKMGPPVYHQLQAKNGPIPKQAQETAANTATAANMRSKTDITAANEEAEAAKDRTTLRTMESTRDAAHSDPNVSWTKKNQDDYYRLYDKVNPPKTAKEQWERRVDRFSQLPEEERNKPEQKAVWRALQAEGVEITGKNTEPKVPTSPFQAGMEAFQRDQGRQPIQAEVMKIYKQTKEADPMGSLRGFLAQSRFDEQKATHVNAVQDRADRAMERASNRTQSEIDKLESKEDSNKVEKDSAEYKSRMAQIEKNEYAAKIAIGKSLQSDLKSLGITVEAPMPQQWESSYMKQTDRDKIFKGGKQEASPTPKETKPPSNADHEVYVKGKLVGHTVNEKYVPLP
jgi:hypothetical protein